VKRIKETIDELVERIERRSNEITEVQRLAEERFRQEWVTFKADDQKRWTNYTLTQEEQRSETVRNFEKLIGQVAQLEDFIQELQDLMQQMNEQSEQRLQSLLALAHEWVSTYERVEGRLR
jgi:spore coat protein CotH